MHGLMQQSRHCLPRTRGTSNAPCHRKSKSCTQATWLRQCRCVQRTRMALARAEAGSDVASSSSSEPAFLYGSAVGQGPRDTMEDEVVVIPNGPFGHCYAGVFDGHGGDFAADWVRENLLRHIESAMHRAVKEQGVRIQDAYNSQGLCCPIDMRDVFTNAFRTCDAELLKVLEGDSDPLMRKAGCTATVALISRTKVFVANIGDSRAVLCRNGRATPLSIEHRLYGSGDVVKDEVERVKSTGAWVVDGRVCDILAVSRAFGDWEFKGNGVQTMLQFGIKEGFWNDEFAEKQSFTSDPVIVTPDVTELDLCDEDDFIVIGTDGLWDYYQAHEVVAYTRRQLQQRVQPDDIAVELVERALKRHAADNVGVVIVDLRGTQRDSDADRKRAKQKQQNGSKGLFGLFKSA